MSNSPPIDQRGLKVSSEKVLTLRTNLRTLIKAEKNALEQQVVIDAFLQLSSIADTDLTPLDKELLNAAILNLHKIEYNLQEALKGELTGQVVQWITPLQGLFSRDALTALFPGLPPPTRQGVESKDKPAIDLKSKDKLVISF